jgi:hypothetical protein
MAEAYLTMAEIEAKYPNEWVLLANPKVTKYQEVLGGVVILHAPDREEFYRLMEAWDDPEVVHLASRYTGKFPAGEPELVESEPGAA